ncbi:hypothetical protein WN55_10851 [Dufourea novaeangliae]|uniref:Uncharacterized protein n=1 Tax=Dufourea novaeangliae TaxID=178035 RepID=A0A154P9M2_DUFNO|nr:hypothetical protein WN55_10851 [Dufourea novaeangliae]
MEIHADRNSNTARTRCGGKIFGKLIGDTFRFEEDTCPRKVQRGGPFVSSAAEDSN